MVRRRSNTGWMGYGQYAPVNRNENKENPFDGTDYSILWENNPYADMYYQPSFWDYIGLSNKAKDANAEYERLYNEYNSGIYELQQQNEYNEPTHQSALNKEAGLNPDLLGINDVGKQSDMHTPNSAPNPALNGVSPAHNAFSTISNVLSFATSTLGKIREIQALNDTTELSTFDILTGIAKPIVEQEYGARLNPLHEPESAKTLYTDSAPKFTSKRLQKRMDAAVKYMFDTMNEKKTKYDFGSDVEESRFRYGNLVGHPDYHGDDKIMFSFIKHQLDFERQIQKIDFSTGAVKKRNEAFLSKMRHNYYESMYNEFLNHGSLLAGLLLLGQQPSIASYIGAAGYGVEKDINKGLGAISKFFDNFNF